MNLGNYIVKICPIDESGIVDNPALIELQQPNDFYILQQLKNLRF